jgi:hypothetical protein
LTVVGNTNTIIEVGFGLPFLIYYLYTKMSAMNILEKKREIISEIDKVNDEQLLEEILRLLHQEDDDIPEWHKQILEERLKKYESGEEEMLDWEEVKKDL